MAEITIHTSYYDRYEAFRASIKVADIYQECFEPARTGDADIFSALAGEMSLAQAKIVVKRRSDAAKIISEALTKIILDAMKAKDTHNGYLVLEIPDEER